MCQKISFAFKNIITTWAKIIDRFKKKQLTLKHFVCILFINFRDDNNSYK